MCTFSTHSYISMCAALRHLLQTCSYGSYAIPAHINTNQCVLNCGTRRYSPSPQNASRTDTARWQNMSQLELHQPEMIMEVPRKNMFFEASPRSCCRNVWSLTLTSSCEWQEMHCRTTGKLVWVNEQCRDRDCLRGVTKNVMSISL